MQHDLVAHRHQPFMLSPPGIIYRVGRSLLRVFLRITIKRSQILNSNLVPKSSASIVVFSQTPSLTDILLLAAELPQKICWLGALKKEDQRWKYLFRFLSNFLGLKENKLGKEDRESDFTQISSVISTGGLIALPVEISSKGNSHSSFSSQVVAEWMWRLVSQVNFRQEIKLLVLHLSHPNSKHRGKEAWLHFAPAISARDILLASGNQSESPSINTLAALIEKNLAQNPFFLREEQVEILLDDLEAVVRKDKKEEWSNLQDWKQDPEDFRLSKLVVRWAQYAQQHAPDSLLNLSESLVQLSEKSQQLSLRQLKLEIAPWWLVRKLRYWRLHRHFEQFRGERRSLLEKIDQVRNEHQKQEPSF